MTKPLNVMLSELAAALPHPPMTRDRFDVYLEDLETVPASQLERALVELRRTSTFFPTLAAIRETVAELTLGLPGEEAALSQVEARIAWGRTQAGDPPTVHPMVRQALAHVGGFPGFRDADTPSVVRAQFLRLYRELRQSEVRSAAVNDSLPAGQRRRELS